MFTTNYYGIKLLNEHLSALVKENGRIVNVASQLGAWALNEMSNDLRNMYLSPMTTKEQLDMFVKDFISVIGSDSVDRFGYNSRLPHFIYGVTKAALISLTRIEARQWLGAKNVLMLSVCPGFCATDLTHYAPGSRPVEFAADSILFTVQASSNE